MLVIKENDEIYVALLYQILFIKKLKEFINCEAARCEIL